MKPKRKSPPLRTICKNGLHPMVEGNIILIEGARRCKTCRRIQRSRQKAKERKSFSVEPPFRLVKESEIPEGGRVPRGHWTAAMRLLKMAKPGEALEIQVVAGYQMNVTALFNAARLAGLSIHCSYGSGVIYVHRLK